MTRSPAVRKLVAGFIARTKSAREAAGKTQAEMAELMGTMQGTYKMWETRTPLPHHLILTFCELCQVDLDWLFTGRK